MRVAIIAGEASGDQLGADLMAGLEADFEGIGGPMMQKYGLDSLFDMNELSLMGVVEVLPKAPHLLRRVRETAAFVLDGNFDVLVTVDSPDFSHRVAKKVKSVQPNLPIIHYVAPSVWAWRPGRAKKMAHHVDHVLCLLPFEPPYMEAAGMSADFVGHPVARQDPPEGLDLWKKANSGVLGLFPGSRGSEISNHINIYREFVKRFDGDLPVMLPTSDHLFDRVSEAMKDIENIEIFSPSHGSEGEFNLIKRRLIYGADMAICTSGTISFELAWAGTNTLVGYRTNKMNQWLFLRLIQVRYASLANILLDEAVIPEYLFDDFSVENLSQAYENWRGDEKLRARQKTDFERMRALMQPELNAAQSVLRFMQNR